MFIVCLLIMLIYLILPGLKSFETLKLDCGSLVVFGGPNGRMCTHAVTAIYYKECNSDVRTNYTLRYSIRLSSGVHLLVHFCFMLMVFNILGH